MALSHTSVVLSTRFDAPDIHDPVTAADVGKSAEFLHNLKKSKTEGHSVITSDVLGEAELVHKKILDRAHAGGAVPAVFTEADRDKMAEMQIQLADVQTVTRTMNAKLDIGFAKLVNLPIRLANSRARELAHGLVRLGVEEPSSPHPLGTLPLLRQHQADGGIPGGIFPATRADLAELGPADLDALATFYGTTFPGTSKAARQASFMLYIGT